MSRKGIRMIGLALLWAWLLNFNVSAAETAVPASMEVSSIYGENGKLGGEIPLHIQIYCQTEQPFTGKVRVKTLESSSDERVKIYEYEYPVTVNPGQTGEMDCYVLLGQKNNELRVTLESGDGTVYSEKSLKFNISREQGQLFIGALSDRAGRLDYLDDVGLDYGMVTTSLFPMEAETFPEDGRGLDLLDFLIINDFDTAGLSEKQKQAIEEWVLDGGRLLIGTGRRGQDTMGRYAAKYLENGTGEPKRYFINLGTEYEVNSPKDAVIDLVCANLSIPGGTEILAGDGMPLLTVISAGTGQTGVFACDLGDLGSFAKKHSGFAMKLISSLLDENEISDLYFYSAYAKDDEYWNASSLVETGSPDRLPNLPLYGVVIVCYLAAAGPGAYLVLKKHDLRQYYGVAVVGLSALAAACVYVIGIRTRFTSEFFTWASIRELDGQEMRETTYLNIRTPDGRPYSVTLSPEFEVTPVTRSGRYDGIPVREFPDGPADLTMTFQEDGTRIRAGKSQAFESWMFRLNRQTEETDGAILSEFTYSDGAVTGYVTNNCGFPLKNTALVLYGQTLFIGDLAAGETRRYENEPLSVWPVDMPYLISDTLVGASDEADSTERMRAAEEKSLYYRYLEKYYGRYTGEARISALGPEGDIFDQIFTGNSPSDGLVLYHAPAGIDREQDGLTERCGFAKTPEVSFSNGTYYQTVMTVYGSDAMTVEYSLGNDIEIEKLSFLPVSDEFLDADQYYYLSRFSGEASFYNRVTGNYDPVDLSRRDFGKEELSPYLSDENEIMIRYVNKADGQENVNAVLPLIMVTGRAK